MARPRKEGMDYFPHDTDASNDEKVYALRSMFGNDGYAFYFILLERIYRTNEAELDVSKPVLLASVVKQVEVTMTRFNELLEASFDINLFHRADYDERKVITSPGIKRRFADVRGMRDKWRAKKEGQQEFSPEFPVEFSPGKTPQITAQETEGKTPQSKAKEIKDINTLSEEAFETWYAIYPKAGSVRKTAIAKWNTLWKEKKIDMSEIMSGTQSYIAFQEHHEYRVCAATVFLNQERWKGDWTIPTANGSSKVARNGKAAYRQGVYQPEVTRVTDEEREFFESLYGNQ